MKTTALTCFVAIGVLFFQMGSSDPARAEQYPRDDGGSLYEERLYQEEQEMMQPGWGQEAEDPNWTQDGNPGEYEEGAWREQEGYGYEGAPADDAYLRGEEATRYEEGYPQDDAARYEDSPRDDDAQPYADAPYDREDAWQGDREQPDDDQGQPYEAHGEELRPGQ